ncbi:hypothetical protein M422DRAFT_84734, partial [Sphaerobolus stellatus SS14]
LLLWIEGAPSPQEIRDLLLNPLSDFNKELLSYYNSSHQGEFINKRKEEVQEDVNASEANPLYEKPTLTLPHPPPCQGCDKCDKGELCVRMQLWWKEYEDTVNDILLRSNVHTCIDGHCKDNKYKTCKARFPREVIEHSFIDADGHIFFQHLESYLNTFSTPLTYMLWCNTDCTCLQSGTGIKAVLMYIADYITKNPLKVYSIFQTL